jgi:xanthine dehydrogenase accessory factor
MANHLSHLLKQWYDEKDNSQWVLGTIYDTQGPCYRKSGAMMLFNSSGQQFGMLSGGCLESDIAINARKVMQSGHALTLCYDGSDEDDLSFQLGIGCGGTVFILLQPVNSANNYLHLDQVHLALSARKSGTYYQRMPTVRALTGVQTAPCDKQTANDCHTEFVPCGGAQANHINQGRAHLLQRGAETWLASPVAPLPHLLVAGGGLDARPLVAMARNLGWQITVWDPRPGNARREYFLAADNVLSGDPEQLTDYVTRANVNAAVLMAHNVLIDAAALKALQSSPMTYMALLGPVHRRDKVLKQANVQLDQLPFVLAGPAGLALGAQLPEGIALSILAECHASLHQAKANSRSDIFTTHKHQPLKATT